MKKIRQILLLIETSRAYGRKIVEGISQYALENGSWEIHIEDRGLFEDLPAWVGRWRGDGIIARTATTSQANFPAMSNTPVVELLGNSLSSHAEVSTDENGIGRMAAEHFVEKGLVHFAFFSYGNSWWAKQRHEAFVRFLSLFGYGCHSFPGMFTGKVAAHSVWNDKYERPLRQWLRTLPRPIGIFGTNDSQAIRLLHACREIGILVPDEVAVLGAGNDTMLCNLQTPSLSSIDLNASKIGYAAAELLERKIRFKGGKNKTPVLISPLGIVLRKSTDMTAIDDPDIVSTARYIRDHACDGINVDRVVREIGLSYTTLLRRFKAAFGRTLEDEITRIRIEQAKYLLRETRLSVAVIGRKVGFRHPEHFARVFRGLERMSPMEFRKKTFVR